MPKDYEFNPPPNWPPPPRGWTPPPGWTPDPQWGPAPPGWEFWVESQGARSWLAEHAVLAGVGAAAGVLVLVVAAAAAFSNGGDNSQEDPEPAAAVSLTARSQEGGPPTLEESDEATPGDSQTSQEPDSSETESPEPSRTRTTATRTGGPGVYPNCFALNKDFEHGVSRPGAKDRPRPGKPEVTDFVVNGKVYRQNKGLDRDGDGIACER